MKLARYGLVACLGLASVTALASPTILIYQEHLAAKTKDDPNVDITQFIGKEYDENGRLVPILYSATDPAFKAAITAGKISDPPLVPTGRQLLEVARKLRADYVIVVSTVRASKLLKSKIKVFHDRRTIYNDESNISVTLRDTMDAEDSARSIAHTFVLRMDSSIFKEFPDRPKVQNPILQPGQTPTVSTPIVTSTPSTSDAELKQSSDALVKSNMVGEAILKMRDAVDIAPFDVERRVTLVNLLMLRDPIGAAEEARRAGTLMPENVDLRVLAARAWMQSGHPEEAQKDLNEAVARDPNGAATRLLLGELSLNQLEPVKALGHLDEVIKREDSAEARYLRALCRALLGGVDGEAIDLAAAAKLQPNPSAGDVAKRYKQAVQVLDRELLQDGSDLRSLIPKIVVKPRDQGFHDQVEQMLRLVQSRLAFLSQITVPPTERVHQDQRLLAHKLLAQSLVGIQTYVTSSDDDLLAEIRINVGEAINQINAAKGANP